MQKLGEVNNRLISQACRENKGQFHAARFGRVETNNAARSGIKLLIKLS